jgi:hypothetical protein
MPDARAWGRRKDRHMPSRQPEADMLHMQHAHVVALLVRQHEAERLKAQRDAVAKARRAAATAGAADAETGAVPPATRRAAKLPRPRPA